MASLTIRDVKKSYGDIQVMHGVDLDVEEGEFVVFVGPSGCGKSTLLRMIAGLEEVTSGEISIGDKVVNDVAPAKRGVAMVFQSYALYPHMTVFNNMAFGLKQAKTPPKCYRSPIIWTAARVTYRVGSVSAWRLAGQLFAIPKFFCLMSHCPIWMPLCACKPVWKLPVCTSV
jgi:ABC-type sugar transport system ATPase subunit